MIQVQDEGLFSVLIVDDEPTIRFGLKNSIDWNELGCSVVGLASTAKEALAIASAAAPDIMITDIRMPEMDGLELIRRIKAEQSHTRFIILSGYDDFNYAKQAISLGVENFLLKPLSKTELSETIKKAIDKIKSTKDNMHPELYEFQESARILFLQQLANGNISSEDEIKSGIGKFGLNLRFQPAIAMVLIMHEQIGKDTLKKIRNTLSDGGFDYFEKDGNSIVCMSNNDFSVCMHAARLISSLSPSITIGIGEKAGSPADISSSLQKAMLAVSYSIYDQNRKIYDPGIITDGDPRFLPSNSNHGKLSEAILRDDPDSSIMEFINWFFSQLMYIPTPPPSYVKGMCFSLYVDTLRTVQNALHADEKSFKEIDYSQFNNLYSLDKIKRYMYELFVDLKNRQIPEIRLANDPVIYQAKKYIEDNISLDITAQEIAGKLDLNAAYFSAYFKQKTGDTFRNYINNKKNERAKELLQDFQLSIEEIAIALGYSDYRSFCRNFKKMNGLPPAAYRKTSGI